jgi:hypothetical protein
MTSTRRHLMMLQMVILVGSWLLPGAGPQGRCHRLHSCPSDHGSYTCGDLWRCDQCPDNQYCLTDKPRLGPSPTRTPAQPAPVPSVPTTPSAVTVCFTPGGNCTDTIVNALRNAKRMILGQGYSLEFISIYDILGLQRKEATAMGTLRFVDLQTRPTEVLDLTSLTLDEFRQLVPPFETTFQAHMAAWRLDGQPRTARRYTTYKNCPLPTPEDRLLFILVYLKTYPLQVVQGRLFGMGQSKAHQWLHVLLTVLQATLRALGDAPTRSVTGLAKRLGMTEADANALVVSVPEPRPSADPPAPTSARVPASPLLGMMAPNGASGVPRIRLSRRAVIAARKSATRSKTCC